MTSLISEMLISSHKLVDISPEKPFKIFLNPDLIMSELYLGFESNFHISICPTLVPGTIFWNKATSCMMPTGGV